MSLTMWVVLFTRFSNDTIVISRRVIDKDMLCRWSCHLSNRQLSVRYSILTLTNYHWYTRNVTCGDGIRWLCLYMKVIMVLIHSIRHENLGDNFSYLLFRHIVLLDRVCEKIRLRNSLPCSRLAWWRGISVVYPRFRFNCNQ